MKIKKIKVIESESPILLIDIGIENDQTFYVSDKIDGKFFLTHNSHRHTMQCKLFGLCE
jgi:hypothetical protein